LEREGETINESRRGRKVTNAEYLTLFSGNGSFCVKVEFKGFNGKVAEQLMECDEIGKLISPETGKFFTELTFDEHPFQIYKYEIDPINERLIIKARQLESN
jgi:hypothetical protein